MVPNTAQISVKAALEAMLVWKRFDLNKPLNGVSDKRRDIFHIVMTPDRIPKFIIPSLDVDHVFLKVESVEGVPDVKREMHIAQQEAPRSKRSQSESNIRIGHFSRGRSLCRTVSDYSTGELEKVADHSDPPTRAALSLPHLPKITTPYGFLALGESPNIRRKESLFFDPDASEIPTVSSMKTSSTASSRSTSSPLRKQQSCQEFPNAPKNLAVPLSWEVLCCPPPCPLPSSSSSSNNCSSKCEKKRFNFLRRKHLPGVRCLKCNGK